MPRSSPSEQSTRGNDKSHERGQTSPRTEAQPSAGARRPAPEEARQAEAEMEAMRQELLSAPAEVVISNHAFGLWQLAALHLSAKPPQLPQAQLAIDALAALLEGLRGRLGDDEKNLADGLTQIRMAFVQIANAQKAKQGAP